MTQRQETEIPSGRRHDLTLFVYAEGCVRDLTDCGCTAYCRAGRLRSQAQLPNSFAPAKAPVRSSPESADYLLEIAEQYPAADTIHLVMDNLSSHTRKAVVEQFGESDGGWLWNRFTVHYTPKHGSFPRAVSAPAKSGAANSISASA